MTELDNPLHSFFRPRGVVLVGASAAPEKLGYGIARNLLASGYTGAIYFVGQSGGQLLGRPLHTDLGQLPDAVDLAVLAVPAPVMPAALRSCGENGIRAAILISAGFREAGPVGVELEQQCLAVAREHGMRLLGPNCIGILDTHLPLDTSFLQPPMPRQGGLAFLSHSGAFCAAVIDWSRREGFGFSQIVSLGNQADVNETDALALVAAHPQTKVIVLYLEGLADGRRFVEVAGEVTRRKPVVALKVGRFEAARKAAASHTGALAASDDAFDAAFRKAGILRADAAEQMFDWARALERCPPLGGRGIAILTDAGGPGVIAADALEANGLSLARLREATKRSLQAALPPAASVQNPVDMLASASPLDYANCLRQLLEDPAVDAALVILPPPPMFTAGAVAEAIIPVLQESAKPAVISLMGSVAVEAARSVFDRAGIPVYPFPERAASALGSLARRSTFLAKPVADYTTAPNIRSDGAIEALSGKTSAQMVVGYGIAIAPIKLATSAEQAASLATALGFPVVLKIASPDVSHKSDVAGVFLNIGSAEAVFNGYAQIVENVRQQRPQALIQGVFVQQQVEAGQDVIVGALQDATFGPIVMFGSGGVEAEGLNDVAFALAPLTREEAMELIARTWAGRKLDGYRSIAPADKAAAVDALVRLSWLAHEHPEIREIEINPLRVLQRGAIALDVRHVL